MSLTELAHVDYVLSTWLGTVVGSLSNFAMNKAWAFYARDAAALPALVRFALVQAGASGLHTLGVWALTTYLHLRYPVSKAAVAAVVYLSWNYPLNRWFVFHRRPESVRPPKGAA